MARSLRGCGCAIAVLAVVLAAAGYVGWKYVYPWWKTKPPPASGKELQVHILDIGPVNGDSILLINGVMELPGVETLNWRIGIHRAVEGRAILIHFLPLLTTFRARGQ